MHDDRDRKLEVAEQPFCHFLLYSIQMKSSFPILMKAKTQFSKKKREKIADVVMRNEEGHVQKNTFKSIQGVHRAWISALSFESDFSAGKKFRQPCSDFSWRWQSLQSVFLFSVMRTDNPFYRNPVQKDILLRG